MVDKEEEEALGGLWRVLNERLDFCQQLSWILILSLSIKVYLHLYLLFSISLVLILILFVFKLGTFVGFLHLVMNSIIFFIKYCVSIEVMVG